MIQRFVKFFENYGFSLPVISNLFLGSPFKIYEFEQLFKGVKFKKNGNLLDFGCGFGRNSIKFSRYVKKVVGIDIDGTKIVYAKKLLKFHNYKNNVEFAKINILEDNIEKWKNYFDHIISICVFEHVQQIKETLIKLNQISKIGGEIHISVDSLQNGFDQSLIDMHIKRCYIEQYFTCDSLKDLLASTGFEVVEIFPILKGDFAKRKFEERIINSSRYNLISQMIAKRKFQMEDQELSNNDKGIFIIARAVKV